MSEKKFIKSIIALFLVGLLFVGYGKYIQHITREEVITSAQLVEVTENGYAISFDGEVHEYN